MNCEYILMNKAVFFPKQKILAVGDLHLGYEHMMFNRGVSLPENQIEEVKSDLEKVFDELKSAGHSLEKIVFLGDIKHFFGFVLKEGNYFRELMEFLRGWFRAKNIILLRGNHDKFDLDGFEMKEYYFEDGIFFLHGHKSFLNTYGKSVRVVVTGHLHPSVVISDKQNVKKEKYKCFLTGKFNGKKFVVLPSFFEMSEGASVNDYGNDYSSDFIVPQDAIMDFEVFVIGADKIYGFGCVGDFTT